MVARLVRDALWRNRRAYAVGGAMLVPFWLLYEATGSVIRLNITTFSLIAAAMIGPIFAIPTMGLRELRHLPVTTRDVWRSTWVIATLVAAGVLLLTRAITVLLVAGFGGSPRMSTETLLISAVHDFTWSGVILLVTAQPSRTPAGIVFGMLGCFGLPILVGRALPSRVADLTWTTTGILIACLAIAIGALAWTPRQGVLAGERALAQRPVARAGAPARPRLLDRLTGISRVAVPYLLALVTLPAGAGLVLVVYGVLSGSGPWWFVPATPTVFDPADRGEPGLTLFVLLATLITTIVGLWTPWARLLKVLPLSVRQINALLLLTPFATWTILWAVGWAAYSLAYGAPHTFRITFVFGMAAFAALAHAGLLRVQGSAATIWIITASGGLLAQVVKLGLRDGTEIMFAVIGAVALWAAAILNHSTLTQSTSSSVAYRRPKPPFGLPATTGR